MQQDNATANNRFAARWRGLKIADTSFTGFGSLSDGGLRVNAGTFIAELPNDGKLHLKHRSKEAEITVSLKSWGRDGDLHIPTFSKPILGKCISDVVKQEIKAANSRYKAQKQCVKQAEQTAEGIQAWWRGGMDSFEQGWKISERPEGSDSLNLTIEFTAVTFNRIQQDLVEMTDSAGNTWTYDGLNAWDSNDQALNVWFEPGDKNEVVIFVDDTDAKYPITVDPWFSTTGNEVKNDTTFDGTIPNGISFSSATWNSDLTTEACSLQCTLGSISGSYNSGEQWWDGYATNASPNNTDLRHYQCGELNSNYLRGDLSNTYFGSQVHSLGDTNGDGYEDILVTAPNWSTSSYSNKGRIFVFNGSASGLETSPTSTILGEADDDYFGTNVLSYRDINNDGYDDIVVASPDKDSNGTDSGSLYTYFGSATGISTTVTNTLAGIEDSANYGEVMDWAGDVNGDGFEDLILGNRDNDTAGTDMGAAYLYYGSASGYASTPDVTWNGNPTIYSASSAYNYDYFGYDVAGIGDINGDGYDDVAVSAPYHDSNGADAGKVYIYLGSSAGISTTAGYARYGSDSDYFGMDLKRIGDINGDGYDELYVDGFVWLGSDSGIAGFYDTTLNIDRDMGDINGDGYDDVMYNNALCYGAADATLSCDSSRSNAQIVADITGDGFYDYISTDSSYDSNRGRIYTYLAFEPDEDLDGYLASEDCNDNDATINPSATEICDDIDNDCDNLIDDEDTVDTTSGTTFYADTDGDGYGDKDNVTVACSVPENYVENSSDCDDSSALAKPGGTELPGDGVDQDCDGGDLCFADSDGDGYRSTAGVTVPSMDLDCDDAGEAASNIPATDCDDLNATINPGATEVPDNGVDEDCNGGESCYVDADDDGYRSTDGATVPSLDMDCLDAGEGATSEPNTDCDDGNAGIHPGVIDVVADGIDQDCDGGDLCYADADDDGFRAIGGLTVVSADADCADAGEATAGEPATDCDDNDANINPGATEIAGDEFDQNCDSRELCWADADQDGFRATSLDTVESIDTDCVDPGEAADAIPATDCDDGNANIHPGATESTGDEIDMDCDGTEICYVDADSDGYREMAAGTVASADTDCADQGEGSINEPATDCNDLDASINPGAQEIIVDGVDQDCDGGDACYADVDGDGQRDNSDATIISEDEDCLDPGEADGNVPATDCDDSDATVYSGATEVVGDGIDNDCDGSEMCYVDADDDGQLDNGGQMVTSDDLDCLDAGEGEVSDPATDCDDSDASIYAGAPETVGDGIDSDCDGMEMCYADADGDSHTAADGSMVSSSDMDCLDSGEGLHTDPQDDCDDNDANIYPGASENADNGIDEDCDGGEMCYADADDDNFRDANNGMVASVDMDCLDPGEGRSIDPATDCDDNDSTINPIGVEVAADGIDQDCNGSEMCYVDADNDGYREMMGLTMASADMDCDDLGEGSMDEEATDCNDGDPLIHPDATEQIADGIDQDCDGGDSCYVDADNDGYRASDGTTIASSDLDCEDFGEADASNSADCNDAQPTVYPGATEVVDNGIDEDCDGGDSCYVDADDDGHLESTGATISSADMDCLDSGEGLNTEPADDCDDNDGSVYPNAAEIPADGIDQDCDGAESCYVDADNDGYRSMDGAAIPSIDSDCDDNGEGAADDPATDCDDNNNNIYPGASESVADGIDQDCDGGDYCYVDADNDGYRGTDGAMVASIDMDCEDIGEASADMDDSDCDDNDASINVDAEEGIADGIDQDCDGSEICWVDADSDGYREIGENTVESSDMDCDDAGEGAADEPASDCDDSLPYTYPGATELVGDGADQDCDGTELCYVDQDGDGYRTLDTVQSLDEDCEDSTEASIDLPAGDCNDISAGINPGATEIPNDGVDQDCDGADEVTGEPSSEEPSEEEPSEEEPSEEEPAAADEVAAEDGDEESKEGCSQINVDTLGWMLLVPAFLFVRRRRKSA